MKSRRSWLIGLALGAMLSFGAVNAQAQGPRLFSYQGLMLDNNHNPVADGGHVVLIEILDGSGNNAAVLYQEQQTVTFTKGVFDVTIGVTNTNGTPPNQLPLGIFNHPTWLKMTFEPGGANEQKFPPQQILSAPYAMNSELANGIQVSPSPVAGNIFPIPMVSGKIDPNFLPPTPATIQTINTVTPDNSGNFSVLGSGGITVTNDAPNHTITIGGGAAALADTLTAGPGIFITPSISPDPTTGSRNRTIAIAQGGLTNNMFGPGAISGSKISQIAGLALAQNQAGLLDLQVDNSTLTIQNNQAMVAPGGITTLQLANGAVNLGPTQTNNFVPNQKVNGILPVANGGTGVANPVSGSILIGQGVNAMSPLTIGGNGTVLTSNGATPTYAALTTNATLLGNGTTTSFAINLANPNTWTANQNFPSIGLTNSTNQIVFGTGTTTTLTVPSPVAARTITLPDVGTNASIILNNSTNGQSISSTAAGSSLTVNSNGSLVGNPALTVNGTTTHNGAVTVNGVSTLNGNVGITGTTTQTGTLNLNGAASPLQLSGSNSLVGQLMVGQGAATPTWLPQGATGQVLVSNGANLAPTWGNLTFDKISNGTNTGNNALLVGNGSVLSFTGTGIINANQVSGVSFGSMTPTSGNIIVANGTSWNSTPMSGDASINSAGVVTLSNTAQARTDIGLGAANAVTFGSLTLGSPLTVASGGTGVSTFGGGGILHSSGGTNALTASAVNLASASEVTGTLAAVNGGTGNSSYTVGDLLVANGAASLARLPIGGANTFLMSNGVTAAWNSGGGAFILNQATTPGSAQVGANFNISGTGIMGAITDNGILNLAGAGSALQVGGNAGTSGQALFSQGPGLPPVWTSLSSQVPNPTAAGQTLYSTAAGPGGWALAPNFFNNGTNLTLTGTGDIQNTGSGNITTASGNISAGGILISGTNALAGRVQLRDGSTANTGTITVTQPFTSNQSYNLPNYSGTFILDNSPNGQTITNANAANPSLTINSATSSATNPALTVKGTSSFGGGITQTSGNLNLSGGGIVNTGSIAGATTITANGLITTSGNITTTGTGTITAANGLTVSAGGANITGGETVNGLLTANNGETITASGLNVTGGIVMTGTGTLNATGSNGTAGQVLISNGNAAAPSWTSTPAITIPWSNVTGAPPAGANINANALLVSGSLAPTGAGTITANQFVGTGSTTNAVDLATAEVAGVLPIANGGTNGTAAPTAGAVAFGTGTAYNFTAAGTSGQFLTSAGAGTPTWDNIASHLTAGAGIGIAGTTNATISNTGVLSFSAGTTGLTPNAATTGAVTLAGTLAATNGGTGVASPTAHGVMVAEGASAMTPIVLGAGQVLIGTTASDPVAATLTAGTAIGINSVSGSITINNNGVTSFSGGTTGLTPNVATTGAVVLAGTLNVANGGTGATTLTSNGVVLGNGTSAVNVTAAGAANQVLRVPGGGGAPAFGAIDLSQAAAVTGTLPVGNGGTGQTSFTTGALLVGNGAGALNNVPDVAVGSVLTSGGVGANPTWGSGSGMFIVNNFSTGTQQANANFWTAGTGRIDANSASPALQLSNAGAGTALTVTQGSSALLNTGVTGTLSSTGSTTLGTTGVTVNTLGNTTAGTNNTISGNTTFDGTNQTTADLVKIQNVPNVAASWGERITATTPGANAAQGIIATANSSTGASNAARFDASGTGTSNTALTLNSTGASGANTGASITVNNSGTSNTGLSVSVNGASRIGSLVNANGGGTAYVANNASTGYDYPGTGGSIPGTATAYNANLGGGLVSQTAFNASNVSAGTGLNVAGVSTNGTGVGITMGAGQGINISGISTGTGLNVSGSGSGVGATISMTGSGKALLVQADGTTATTALEVGNHSQVRATGTNGQSGGGLFADTYTLTLADHGALVTTVTISNNLVTAGSTIIITPVSNGGVVGDMTISSVGAGSFQVATTALDFTGVDKIHYMVVNH